MILLNPYLALSPDFLKTLKKKFESEPKNLLAVCACAKTDPLEVCLHRKVVESTSHAFTHKVRFSSFKNTISVFSVFLVVNK